VSHVICTSSYGKFKWNLQWKKYNSYILFAPLTVPNFKIFSSLTRYMFKNLLYSVFFLGKNLHPSKALWLCTDPTAHRGSRCEALPFLYHGTRMRGGTASNSGRYLTQGKTRYPLHWRQGGPQGRSGHVRICIGIRVKRDGRTERFNVRILPLKQSFVRITNIETKIWINIMVLLSTY
jgi:hypothetical protein